MSGLVERLREMGDRWGTLPLGRVLHEAADTIEAQGKRLAAYGESCPDAAVCQSCPCAVEDDACFPGERLRAERDQLEKRLAEVEAKYSDAADRQELMERWEVATKRAVAAEKRLAEVGEYAKEKACGKGKPFEVAPDKFCCTPACQYCEEKARADQLEEEANRHYLRAESAEAALERVREIVEGITIAPTQQLTQTIPPNRQMPQPKSPKAETADRVRNAALEVLLEDEEIVGEAAEIADEIVRRLEKGHEAI